MQKRVVSLWFPRLASDRVLRARPIDAPFAVTIRESNTDRLYCLNEPAERLGLARGMGLSDTRALCPDIQTEHADTNADLRFQQMLARWAKRYCPWVGLDGADGLILDVTGSVHLFGGEQAMLSDMRVRLMRSSLNVRIGLAATRGAAWALAHFGEGVIADSKILDQIGVLPIAALRVSVQASVTMQRLGIRTIADLAALPRATITRRFGPDPLMRLDQALGAQPESVRPLSDPPHYGVRLTLPEPIGLAADVMAGLKRLLDRLCKKLKAQEQGARVLQLTLRRVDQVDQQVELRLARPMCDTARILPLFEHGIQKIDAGFGIDRLRLEATQIDALPVRQLSAANRESKEGLDDLITRLGNRIGLDNITRFLPADSHIPERSFSVAPAAYCEPAGSWPVQHPRPLRLFPPEPIIGSGREPPSRFRWRRMTLSTARATGPERIAPEWWLGDENWGAGLRDYWHVETQQGWRLWLFHTPQNPGWFVQGEFA